MMRRGESSLIFSPRVFVLTAAAARGGGGGSGRRRRRRPSPLSAPRGVRKRRGSIKGKKREEGDN